MVALFKSRSCKDEPDEVKLAKEMVALADDIKMLRLESERIIESYKNMSYEDTVSEVPSNIVRRIRKRTAKIYNKYYKNAFDNITFTGIGMQAVDRYDEWLALATT